MAEASPVPTNARRPADHQAKKPGSGKKRNKKLTEGGPPAPGSAAGPVYRVSVRGRKWKIQAEALDDFEVIDDLDEIEAGNHARIPRVLKRLLGKDGYAEALDFLRDPKTGRIPVAVGLDFVGDILTGLGAFTQGK